MHFHPIITDYAFYVFLIALLFLGIKNRKSPKTIYIVRQLSQSRTAVFSCIILLFFLSLALIDSLHFQVTDPKLASEGKQVESLLDRLAPRLAYSNEVTYSYPLSDIHLKKVRYIDKNNRVQYRQKELEHITQHDNHTKHVFFYFAIGFFSGCALSLLLIFVFLALLALKRRQTITDVWQSLRLNQTKIKWQTAIVTVATLIILTTSLGYSSTHYHLLGTDRIGHDVFYQAIKGVRTALIIGIVSTVSMIPPALFFGLCAGYFRGWVDDVIQYVYTTISSIPGVLLISSIVLVMQLYFENHPLAVGTIAEQSDINLLTLCLVLGLTSWAGLCRLIRGETLKVKSLNYVKAAESFGLNRFIILFRHILPNVFYIVLITLSLDFSGMIMAEAILTYVGVGVDTNTASWGNMINNSRLELGRDPVIWWNIVAAITLMFILVLAANLFADALRDALDPETESGHG